MHAASGMHLSCSMKSRPHTTGTRAGITHPPKNRLEHSQRIANVLQSLIGESDVADTRLRHEHRAYTPCSANECNHVSCDVCEPLQG